VPVEKTLLFKCPKCRWWIGGSHFSEESIEAAKLAEIMFNLKCASPGCGWTGACRTRRTLPITPAITIIVGAELRCRAPFSGLTFFYDSQNPSSR